MVFSHLFNLPPEVHFINCATRGPFSKAVEKAGMEAISTFTPTIHQIRPDDFFEGAWKVRRLFSELVNAQDSERIAIIPSVSYGMGVVAKNLYRKSGLRAGQQILIVGDEFPSDVYPWQRVCEELGLVIKTIPMPLAEKVGQDWNTQILEAIS